PDGGSPDAGHELPTPTPAPDGKPWDTLAEWHLFDDAVAQTPAKYVTPYEVIAPLFSDYTSKYRFLYVPPGQKIAYNDADRWDFPVGALLIKTFAYPVDGRDPSKGQRLLETRLLVREAGGWVAHTYEWDAAQMTATKKVVGDTIDMTWIDE